MYGAELGQVSDLFGICLTVPACSGFGMLLPVRKRGLRLFFMPARFPFFWGKILEADNIAAACDDPQALSCLYGSKGLPSGPLRLSQEPGPILFITNAPTVEGATSATTQLASRSREFRSYASWLA